MSGSFETVYNYGWLLKSDSGSGQTLSLTGIVA